LSNGGQTPQSGERVVRELDQYQAHRLDEDFTSKCPFAEINLSANHLRDQIKALLDTFGIEHEALHIYLRRDRDADV
jgi:hypothetical protein